MTSLLFSPGLWCLIWAMSCYTYPLMTNSVSWLMYQNRTRTCEGKEKSIEMLCRLTGLCSRRRKRPRSDDVACFCFHSERECGAEAGRGSMYVCRVPVRWGIFHPPARPSLITSQLWSNSQGREGNKSQAEVTASSRRTRTHKKCNLHNLFSKLLRWRDLWVPDNPSGLTNAIKQAPSPHLFLITACGAKTWEYLNAYEAIYLNINSCR